MAAILDPRSHPRTTPVPTRSVPPRHLAAVTAAPAGPRSPGRPHPRAVVVPAAEDALLTPAMLAAAAAAVVAAILLSLGIGSGAFSALVPTPGSAPAAGSAATVVVVEPGDSIWSIARQVQPSGDVRPLVHRIIQANGSSPLHPGQELVVPR